MREDRFQPREIPFAGVVAREGNFSEACGAISGRFVVVSSGAGGNLSGAFITESAVAAPIGRQSRRPQFDLPVVHT